MNRKLLIYLLIPKDLINFWIPNQLFLSPTERTSSNFSEELKKNDAAIKEKQREIDKLSQELYDTGAQQKVEQLHQDMTDILKDQFKRLKLKQP